MNKRDLKIITQEEADSIIDRHEEYLNGDTDCALADFSDTDLSGIDLSNAFLNRANFSGADLRLTNLEDCSLGFANMSGALLPDDVPFVENLDTRVLDLMLTGHRSPYKNKPPSRSGYAEWVVYLGGVKKGYALAGKIGLFTAAQLIYAKSRPDRPIPVFYSDFDEVISYLKELCDGLSF
jgi:hypothetical protein